MLLCLRYFLVQRCIRSMKNVHLFGVLLLLLLLPLMLLVTMPPRYTTRRKELARARHTSAHLTPHSMHACRKYTHSHARRVCENMNACAQRQLNEWPMQPGVRLELGRTELQNQTEPRHTHERARASCRRKEKKTKPTKEKNNQTTNSIITIESSAPARVGQPPGH